MLYAGSLSAMTESSLTSARAWSTALWSTATTGHGREVLAVLVRVHSTTEPSSASAGQESTKSSTETVTVVALPMVLRTMSI